jgi:hypothetical protein
MGSAVIETDDAAVADAQAQVDALEAGKTTEPAKPADKVTEPVADKTTEPTETPEAKAARERDAAGKFLPDYSKVILPKDAAIDADALGRTVAIARERGLSSEQAQSVVDLINGEVAQSRAALLAAHQPGGAEWTKQLDAWKAETLADASLGKTPEERTAAIQRGAQVLKKYGEANPEDAKNMEAFLTESGLGEHPAAVRFFHWLGKAAGERAIVLGSDSSVGGTSAIARKYQDGGMNP